MGLQNISIADGVRLHCLPTGKFKTNFMSVSFTAPLEAGVNAMNSLIPNILLRGSEKYPDMAAINKRLDYLYAAGISTRCSKRGDVQVFGLCADMLDHFGNIRSLVADALHIRDHLHCGRDETQVFRNRLLL